MGKGDKDRTKHRKQYEKNYDSINWKIETSDGKKVAVHSVGVKSELPICKICNLPITPHELATYNDDGTCHSGCVFASGDTK